MQKSIKTGEIEGRSGGKPAAIYLTHIARFARIAGHGTTVAAVAGMVWDDNDTVLVSRSNEAIRTSRLRLERPVGRIHDDHEPGNLAVKDGPHEGYAVDASARTLHREELDKPAVLAGSRTCAATLDNSPPRLFLEHARH